MICFLYPGQPLAFGAPLINDPDGRAIARLCRERTGFDPQQLAWLAEPAGTEQTALQIYGTALSLCHARQLRQAGTRPALVGEHSMGIYPALAESGSLPEGEALELTARVGNALARMGLRRTYALGCIVGLTLEPLLAIAEEHEVYLANGNTSRHFLLSGRRPAIEEAVNEALQCGAFSARTFPCDAPLHTPLIEEVGQELREIFADYRFQEPHLPLFDHIDQECLTAAELPGFLLRELCSPVQWERTYRALRTAGATVFHEVGMAGGLLKYNRWIDSESRPPLESSRR